jgi:hypothetical protein
MHLVHINGRPYAYQSVWRRGRSTSRYVASGELAVLLFAAAAEECAERQRERELALAEAAEYAAVERVMVELSKHSRDVARQALNDAGHFQHARGQWRKRRRG